MFRELQISCPVSINKVNENIARITSFFAIIFTILSLTTGNPMFVILMAGDFAIRAFTIKGNSPIRIASRKIGKFLKVKEKLTDTAPKRFAAGLGFIFCTAIAFFEIIGMPKAALYPGATLLVCAFLEGVFSFCLGCITYTYFVMPFKKKIKPEQA